MEQCLAESRDRSSLCIVSWLRGRAAVTVNERFAAMCMDREEVEKPIVSGRARPEQLWAR